MIKKLTLIFALIFGLLSFVNVGFAETLEELEETKKEASEAYNDNRAIINEFESVAQQEDQAYGDEIDAKNAVQEAEEVVDNSIGESPGDQNEAKEALKNAEKELKDVQSNLNSLTSTADELQEEGDRAREQNEALSDANNKANDAVCEKTGNCIDKTTFTISVNEISPGMKITKGDSVEQVINRTLGTIIQKLMIALGSLSLLIMTIGGGYMILYHGQDELLSKGKSIFLSGITALVVALSSYYMVAFLRYILYFDGK